MKRFDIYGFENNVFGIMFNNEIEFKDFSEKFHYDIVRFCNPEKYPQFADCVNQLDKIIFVEDHYNACNYIKWKDYMGKPENISRNKIEIFKSITDKMNKIYEAKNNDYGDSFTKVRNKYPNSVIIRLNDKLNRLESLMSGKRQMVSKENINDTLLDMANYCIMELVEREIENECGKEI